jgi:NTE family protein
MDSEVASKPAARARTAASAASGTASRPAAAANARATATTKPITLALQGGGAHGAFTWGVLDRLLEDGRLTFEGVSATSAGAMNASVMAYGLAKGGHDGAREALHGFWRRISEAGAKSPLQPTWYDKMMGNHSLEASPAFVMFDLISRLLSPYQFNPGNFNPLRQVLEASVDFEMLRNGPMKVFLSATNVRTGKIKMFEKHEIGPDAVLASGCLPFLFQAVEIDGEAYWDGGYMGNPAIFPLIYGCECSDVLIVHINPLERPELPRTASDILNRINEISFNSSLMREMRAISFVSKMIDQGIIREGTLKLMKIHGILDDETMTNLGVASKLNADWDFLMRLHDAGRQRATAWLKAHFDSIGVASTVDIAATYL